jgi:Sulfotransferase domain
MTLSIIGAGFGRTGTMTLKVALEQLGLGPCYHMVEVFKNPQASGWWIDAADGKPDWAKIFNGYNACVDWPGATFYGQLAQAYPDAKVILTEREPEAWFRSTQSTIFPNATPPASDVPFDQMFRKVIARLFDSRMRDHDHVIDVFKRHNAAVRQTIAPERLLVYDVTQGWAPLCSFLGVDVPSTPLPTLNTTEDFGRMVRSLPVRD